MVMHSYGQQPVTNTEPLNTEELNKFSSSFGDIILYTLKFPC